jgi:hypothetical protein
LNKMLERSGIEISLWESSLIMQIKILHGIGNRQVYLG